ncbi:hypothetical protein RZS08_38290, partial [Arthrospira platensis SPKY1]|nr:hypothetical protein [Arthrospira platensis SPKY1]
FGEPDGGFDRFDLTEERARVAERVLSPVLEQTGGFRGDLLLAGRQGTPGVHVLAHDVDDGRDVVLLGRRRESLAFGEDHRVLARGGLALFRLGNGRDELGAPAVLDDPLGRLAGRVQFPMAAWVFVGGIEDGAGEEGIG